jgi:hypothetical protein
MEQNFLHIPNYRRSSAHSAGTRSAQAARGSVYLDTPEPSDEALEQLIIAVMKLSINLMLLCGVPLLYGRP